jgi:hypothetical protein
MKLLERLREFEPKLMTLALQCQQLLKLWEAGKPLIVQKRIPRVRFDFLQVARASSRWLAEPRVGCRSAV